MAPATQKATLQIKGRFTRFFSQALQDFLAKLYKVF